MIGYFLFDKEKNYIRPMYYYFLYAKRYVGLFCLLFPGVLQGMDLPTLSSNTTGQSIAPIEAWKPHIAKVKFPPVSFCEFSGDYMAMLTMGKQKGKPLNDVPFYSDSTQYLMLYNVKTGRQIYSIPVYKHPIFALSNQFLIFTHSILNASFNNKICLYSINRKGITCEKEMQDVAYTSALTMKNRSIFMVNKLKKKSYLAMYNIVPLRSLPFGAMAYWITKASTRKYFTMGLIKLIEKFYVEDQITECCKKNIGVVKVIKGEASHDGKKLALVTEPIFFSSPIAPCHLSVYLPTEKKGFNTISTKLPAMGTFHNIAWLSDCYLLLTLGTIFCIVKCIDQSSLQIVLRREFCSYYNIEKIATSQAFSGDSYIFGCTFKVFEDPEDKKDTYSAILRYSPKSPQESQICELTTLSSMLNQDFAESPKFVFPKGNNVLNYITKKGVEQVFLTST